MSEPVTAPAYLDVVFDGPPGHEPGRFVEVEDPDGRSVNAGEWIDRGDGLWALRIPRPTRLVSREALEELFAEVDAYLTALHDGEPGWAERIKQAKCRIATRACQLREQCRLVGLEE
ncbi:MAG: hypothetical protein IT434_09550 [Phycisphaerales bacterium]|nr:hypothetical protein [Phycisphaerales bacterium]